MDPGILGSAESKIISLQNLRMVGKGKAAAAAATLEEAPEAAVDAPAEAPAEPAPEAPAEEVEKKEEEKKESSEEDKDKKKKKKKKVVPSWATLSDDARSKLAKAGSMQKPKMTDAIVEAIKMCGDSKGAASASSIRSMIMSDHPDLPKMVLKKAMAKAVEKGMVTQVKGKGFSGSFKLGKGKPAEKKAAEGGKKGAKKVNCLFALLQLFAICYFCYLLFALLQLSHT